MYICVYKYICIYIMYVYNIYITKYVKITTNYFLL